MAGQVAQEGVVLPAAGAISATALIGILGIVVAVGVALSGNHDDSATATPATGTR